MYANSRFPLFPCLSALTNVLINMNKNVKRGMNYSVLLKCPLRNELHRVYFHIFSSSNQNNEIKMRSRFNEQLFLFQLRVMD
jgi:hypothetical protein